MILFFNENHILKCFNFTIEINSYVRHSSSILKLRSFNEIPNISFPAIIKMVYYEKQLFFQQTPGSNSTIDIYNRASCTG
jgi:hypothetical protein